MKLSYRRHVIRTNLNPMGSTPPMALSERPQHTAPCPLLALYMESPNGWSGLPVTQYGNLVSRPLMTLSLHAIWALYGKSQKGQPGPLMALSARPRYAAHRSHRHCIENPKRAGLNLAMALYCNLGHNSMGFPNHYISSPGVPGWAQSGTTSWAQTCGSGPPMALHFEP